MRAIVRSKKLFEGKYFSRIETPKELDVPVGGTIKIEEAYSVRQQGLLFGMFNDIAGQTGYSKEEIHAMIKGLAGVVSVGETDKDGMGQLIDTTISFVKEHDITLSIKTVEQMEAEQRMEVCTFKKVCMLCGQPADEHHVDRVGMGRDRDEIEYTGELLPLCRVHHTELHSTGDSAFRDKYLLDHAYDSFFERNK